MRLLAIETSCGMFSVALMEDGNLVDIFLETKLHRQAEDLPGAVVNLLSRNATTLESLTHIAVSVGPGSFTGVRIGLGYCYGLSFGTNLPIIPVTTLDCIAWQSIGEVSQKLNSVTVGMEAGRGEIYQADYKKNSTWESSQIKLVARPEGYFQKYLPNAASAAEVAYQKLIIQNAWFSNKRELTCSPLYVRESDAVIKNKI